MLQTSLLLMKSLNKTETSIFQSVVCSLFTKIIVLTFIWKKNLNSAVIMVNTVFLIQKYNSAVQRCSASWRQIL